MPWIHQLKLPKCSTSLKQCVNNSQSREKHFLKEKLQGGHQEERGIQSYAGMN